MLSSCVTIARQFLRSVRIDADYGREDAVDGYVIQPSAKSVLENIARQITQTRQRAFTITGPYGGGKSSLALTLASLAGGEGKLQTNARKVLGLQPKDEIAKVFGRGRWLVLPVVGHRASVQDEIARTIDQSGALRKAAPAPRRHRDVIDELLRLSSSTRFSGVLLLIDELGKFLEHAAASGADIFFYQQLAEAASRANGTLVVVGVLHQSFEQYASRLGQAAREEWAKVQGRFIDIPLLAGSDETIELIGRAIERTSSAAPPRKVHELARVVASVIRSRRPASSTDLGDALERCWPLHAVTAALLGPSAKRRFGQNERSIFGFLSSAEPLAFREFLAGSPLSALYTPAMYWDYLSANFEAAILSSPDGHRWSLGAEAVERCEARFSPVHTELVKTVALVELFRNGSGLAAEDDLLATCVAADKARLKAALGELAAASILIYRKHLQAWGVYAGSDFDIEAAVRAHLADRAEPDLKKLSSLGDLHPITARRHYSITGTMRWFRRLLARPQDLLKVVTAQDQGGASGSFALLIPATVDEARSAGRLAAEATRESATKHHAVGVPRNAQRIAELALELEALNAVRTEERKVHDDPVARREIDARVAAATGALGDALRDGFLDADWYWKGEKQPTERTEGLSPLATRIADDLYASAPHLHSELVNRDELSSAAAKAQRELMHRMLSHAHVENLGYEGYPADAGLYYSLIKPAGLHRADAAGRWAITPPDESTPRAKSLRPLWEATGQLVAASERPLTLAEIYDHWRTRFGLRRGVMPILATAFFLAHRATLGLYVEGTFTPELKDSDLDEWLQDQKRIAWRFVRIEEDAAEMLKSLAMTLRKRLGREVTSDPLDAARGLVRLVFSLPDWTRRTNTISSDAKSMRDLLLKASDPHKVLFADLPTLLGVRTDRHLAERVADLASELEDAFPRTLRHVEGKMLHALDHEGPLEGLRARAKVVQGISGDFRLDAYAGRLAQYEGSLTDIQGFLMLALNKPASQWTDHDVDAGLLQLCTWAMEFRRVEALAAIRDRPATRRAIAVVFGAGAGHGGKTVSSTFDVAAKDTGEVERVVSDLLAACLQRNVKREVVLAALAEAGARLVEEELEGANQA